MAADEPGATVGATIVLVAQLDRLPKAERPAFVRAVASRLPGPRIDCVRLNVVARRADPD